MAGLDSRYIVGAELGEVFIDPATGLPLANGTLHFYKDTARNIPKLVYQLAGSPPNYSYVPLANELTLSDVGTIVNPDTGVEVSIYYFPWGDDGDVERYFIQLRSSADVVVKEWQAWPNNFLAGDSPDSSAGIGTENQISNSQFVDVLFNPENGVTFSFTGAVTNKEFEVAPNWVIRVSSSNSGSVIVNRTPIEGSLNLPGNPPFMLRVSPQANTITDILLVQKFSNNPDIWANQYIAGTMLVHSVDSISHAFEMKYVPSINANETVVCSGSTSGTEYTVLSGTVLLGPGDNTDSGDNGYIDLEIVLPVSGNYEISNLQLIGTDSSASLVPYQQETVNRQEDHLFNYYNPVIQQVAVPSLAVGWDFKMNPAQWGATQSMTTEKSKYIWDQTIVWQSTDNLMSFYRNNAYEFRCDIANVGQFALVQYLSGAEMQALLSDGWSVLIDAYTLVPAGSSGQVSFWYTTDASLPNIAQGTNLSIVNTLDAYGKPLTFNGSWTELKNESLGEARFVLDKNPSQEWLNRGPKIALNGWARPSSYDIPSTATYVAIVVGFAPSSSGAVVFNNIAVTPGKQSRPVAPLTYEATLQHLRKYYEKSYDVGVPEGTPNSFSTSYDMIVPSLGTEGHGSPAIDYFLFNLVPLHIQYKAKKVNIPKITFFDPASGTPDRFGISVYGAHGTLSSNITPQRGAVIFSHYYLTISITQESAKYFYRTFNSEFGISTTSYLDPFYVPSTDNAAFRAGAPYYIINSGSNVDVLYPLCSFHYALDARLGIF